MTKHTLTLLVSFCNCKHYHPAWPYYNFTTFLISSMCPLSYQCPLIKYSVSPLLRSRPALVVLSGIIVLQTPTSWLFLHWKHVYYVMKSVLDDSINLSVTHIDGYKLKGEVCLWSAVVFFRVTRCGKLHTEVKSGAISGKVYGRGCATQAQCENAKTTILRACEDAKDAGADADCEVNCCSGDLCNAGTTPVISGLLILSCALVALFRWARTVLLGKQTWRDRN